MKFKFKGWPLGGEISKTVFRLSIPLRIKFTFYIGMMALLWMTALAAICIWQSLENTQELMHERLSQFASLKSQQIQRSIENQVSAVNSALQGDIIANTLENYYYGNLTNSLWSSEMESSVKKIFFTSFHAYQLIYFYDYSGNFLFSTSNPDVDNQTLSSFTPELSTLLPLGMTNETTNRSRTSNSKFITKNMFAGVSKDTDFSSSSFPATSISSKINFTKTSEGIWSWLSHPVPLVDVNNNVTQYSYSITVPLLHLTVNQSVQTSKLIGYCTVVIDCSFYENLNRSWYLYGSPVMEGMKTFSFTIIEANPKSGWRYLFPTGKNSTLNRNWHPFGEFPAIETDLNLMNHMKKSFGRNLGGAIMKTQSPTISKASVGFSYAKALNQDWLITIALPQSQVESSYRRQTKALLGVAIAILVLVVIYAFFLTSLITYPMHHIYRGMELKSVTHDDESTHTQSDPHHHYHNHHRHHSDDYHQDLDSILSDSDSPSGTKKNSNISTKQVTEGLNLHHSTQVKIHPTAKIIHRMLSQDTTYSTYTMNSTIGDENDFRVPQPLQTLNRWWIRDEFDELIAEYNAMIYRLNSQYLKMEDEVRLRTHEARESQRLAEAASAAKSLFMMNISHELLTPLNGIMGITAVTLEETSLPRIQASLRTIIKSGNLLHELLQELLNYASHLAGVEEDYKEFTVGSLAKNIEQTFSSRAESKNIDFKVILQPTQLADCIIGTDLDRIRHICTSLVSNAIKFSDPEKLAIIANARRSLSSQSKVVIQASLRTPDNNTELTFNMKEPVAILEVVINDSGVGISRDRLKHIFEAFVQGDDALHKRFTGTGLGLAISKMMSEKLRGHISVYSRVNIGTMVVLRVPVVNVDNFETVHATNLHLLEIAGNRKVWYTDSKLVGKVGYLILPLSPPSIPDLSNQTMELPYNQSLDISMNLPVGLSSPHRTSQGQLSHISDLKKHDLQIGEINELTGDETNHENAKSTDKGIASNKEDISVQLPARVNSSPIPQVEQPSTDYSKLRVLVADDNDIMRVLVQKFLINLGMTQVDVATDGDSVIALIENAIVNGTKYSLIFMDLEMPGYDGVEATINMRKQLGYYCPVVALTGHSDEKTVQKCLDAGLQKVLVKPISQKSLAKTIDEFI